MYLLSRQGHFPQRHGRRSFTIWGNTCRQENVKKLHHAWTQDRCWWNVAIPPLTWMRFLFGVFDFDFPNHALICSTTSWKSVLDESSLLSQDVILGHLKLVIHNSQCCVPFIVVPNQNKIADRRFFRLPLESQWDKSDGAFNIKSSHIQRVFYCA